MKTGSNLPKIISFRLDSFDKRNPICGNPSRIGMNRQRKNDSLEGSLAGPTSSEFSR